MALRDLVESLRLGRLLQTKVGRSIIGKLGVRMLLIWRNNRKCLYFETSIKEPLDIKAELNPTDSVR